MGMIRFIICIGPVLVWILLVTYWEYNLNKKVKEIEEWKKFVENLCGEDV